MDENQDRLLPGEGERKKRPDLKDQINDLAEKCCAGRGAMIFCAVLSDKKDNDGNSVIEFQYIRHKYPFEDLPKAVNALRRHMKNDIANFNGVPPAEQ